ncbi:substrate-specific component YkoE of thiamin-regulated ECF transporter for hydroxymethylpyrimidine [Lentilactobacillus kosonis]|uniref:Substrate-specific component YkoE of thiamin-regulated ECF transporter for hydroxymethylpyrimidine n=1 Tax=Lentilactobacillus kosonis TaxID=2810561 RepID=A0A401FMB2_9LACO|nr:substrate-specific component YkoE of thiamin-regulated ECF transporter for hydroxymethylpyrimidine [Lentilactobacillus kosonis]
MMIALFITRYISTFIFGGLLTKAITNMLDRSHISVSTNN